MLTLGSRDDISHLASEGVGGVQRHLDRPVLDDGGEVVVPVKIAVCVGDGSNNNLHHCTR